MAQSTPIPYVVVVDDDASVRAAVESLIRSAGLAVRSFATAQELLECPLPDAPGCLILDLRLPGGSGLDVQCELAQRHSLLPIIFVTGHGDIPTSVRAMKSGAVGFLAKPFHDQELLDAVSEALAQARVAHRVRTDLADLLARLASLTPREREVMNLVVAGLLNKQIAYDLGISEVTVKLHRGRVMHKMRAASLPDLVRMAERAEPRTGDDARAHSTKV